MELMSEKVGEMGGNMGGAFDDGVFDGVKKIIVGKDLGCVSYIKIEYEKDGKFETREHGTIRGELKEFAVEYPNEYIISVGGSYERVPYYETVLIKSLFFKTTYSRISPIFGETTFFGKPAGREFLLEGKNGGRLLGFHGRSGQALDAIGPYFFAAKPPLKHFDRQGGNGGGAWDDGAYDGIRKILVGRGGKFVSYVRFEYAKGERMVPHAHGKRQEVPQEFVVNYPHEHITSVEGTIDGYLTSLNFKTSKGRTSPAYGNVVGRKFVFEEKDFKLVGFCGRSGDAIDALGAHFGPLPAPAPTPNPTPDPTPTPVGPDSGDGSNSEGGSNSIQKLDAQGGKGGNHWDDGGDHDGVTKIHIAVGRVIEQIRFDYLKNGQTKEGPTHGVKGARSSISTFQISHPDEYLLSVKGWSDSSNKVVGIQFITNTKTSEYYGFEKYPDDEGTDVSLEVKDKKIVGFHGFADPHLNSLGAYFAPITSTPTPAPAPATTKIGPLGGSKGNTFDDGVFNGVKKLAVGADEYSITYIKIEYVKEEKVEIREHGTNRGELKEFSVDYPNDNITAVGGSYKHIFTYDTTLVTSLYFTTSKGFTSPLFGETKGTEFELKGENGGKLLGFHGRGGHAIDAIGGFFETTNPGRFQKLSEKLGPLGGIKGETFDDGVFDGVKTVTVGKDVYSVTYIKIEYANGGKFETREHGTNRGEIKEFSVDYPNDFITAVGGSYNHIFNYDTTLITSIYFTTSKGLTSPLFGELKGTEFELKGKNGGKLLGFHGRGGHAIDSIGAHFERVSGAKRLTL